MTRVGRGLPRFIFPFFVGTANNCSRKAPEVRVPLWAALEKADQSVRKTGRPDVCSRKCSRHSGQCISVAAQEDDVADRILKGFRRQCDACDRGRNGVQCLIPFPRVASSSGESIFAAASIFRNNRATRTPGISLPKNSALSNLLMLEQIATANAINCAPSIPSG